MKPRIFKTAVFLLLLAILGAGCEKDELEYADESIVLTNNPGFCVYKTKKEYFDKVWVQITDNGELNQIESLDENSTNIRIDSKGNVIPLFRYLLKSGYMVGDAHANAAYTDITFTEYLKYNIENQTDHWSHELIEPRIIDRDPYEELYWLGCLNCKIERYTLGEINDMIESGTLETVFEKIK